MGGRPRGLNAQGDDTQDFCQLSILSDLQLFISQNPSFISLILARPLPRYHVDPFREGLDPSRVTWHEESRRKAKLKPKLLQSLIQKRSQSLSHPLPPLSIRDKKPFLKIPIDPPLKIQWFAHQQRKRMRLHKLQHPLTIQIRSRSSHCSFVPEIVLILHPPKATRQKKQLMRIDAMIPRGDFAGD